MNKKFKIIYFRTWICPIEPLRLRLRGEVHVVHVRAGHPLLLADPLHRSPALVGDQASHLPVVVQPVSRRHLRIHGVEGGRPGCRRREETDPRVCVAGRCFGETFLFFSKVLLFYSKNVCLPITVFIWPHKLVKSQNINSFKYQSKHLDAFSLAQDSCLCLGLFYYQLDEFFVI